MSASEDYVNSHPLSTPIDEQGYQGYLAKKRTKRANVKDNLNERETYAGSQALLEAIKDQGNVQAQARNAAANLAYNAIADSVTNPGQAAIVGRLRQEYISKMREPAPFNSYQAYMRYWQARLDTI